MSENALAGQRRIALIRFALDFLKANLEDLESDGLLEGFDPLPTADELDKLKEQLQHDDIALVASNPAGCDPQAGLQSAASPGSI